ncbi:MAG: hypothetical protein ACK5KP_03025, partial [Paludibacteraceae bacterium]
TVVFRWWQAAVQAGFDRFKLLQLGTKFFIFFTENYDFVLKLPDEAPNICYRVVVHSFRIFFTDITEEDQT